MRRPRLFCDMEFAQFFVGCSHNFFGFCFVMYFDVLVFIFSWFLANSLLELWLAWGFVRQLDSLSLSPYARAHACTQVLRERCAYILSSWKLLSAWAMVGTNPSLHPFLHPRVSMFYIKVQSRKITPTKIFQVIDNSPYYDVLHKQTIKFMY